MLCHSLGFVGRNCKCKIVNRFQVAIFLGVDVGLALVHTLLNLVGRLFLVCSYDCIKSLPGLNW